jgi:ribonucleoside-triphosphate reductase
MIKLTPDQLQAQIDFIEYYMRASNAAEGSKLDANANVSSKNIATLSGELPKPMFMQLNDELIRRELVKKYGEEDPISKQFIEQQERHEIYVHDKSRLQNYCAAITCYRLLSEGLRPLGGESKRPNHLMSFCGIFTNLMFAISSQLAGAVAAVEFLMYFDYYAKKDYGDNYLETHPKEISNFLQFVIYTINQPSAARDFQSIFFNISIFDRHYFESMFGNFTFPDEDFTKPSYESLDKLQRFFMKWLNKERTESVLTFPVVTAATLNDGEKMLDEKFHDFIAEEYSQGNSFFTFTSDNAESLSSCCRLKKRCNRSNK